jgi:hypothetical protein
MDVPQAMQTQSIWADLDALVLEEMEALRAGPDRPDEAPGIGSDDDFIFRASAHLRRHPDPEALVQRLCVELGLFQPPGEAPPAGEASPPTPPESGDRAPAAESGSEDEGEGEGEGEGEA